MSKGWDLTSTNSLQSAARWIQKGSGALLVLVLREDDAAYAMADHIPQMVVDQVLVQLDVLLKGQVG